MAQWSRGCLTARSSWVRQPFDWVFVCMFSPCLCGQTGDLVGVPSLSPSGSWGRLQPVTNHILSIYYSGLFCYGFFFFFEPRRVLITDCHSCNCIGFILVYGLHLSAEQEDGEFVSSSTVNQSTLIPNLIFCHELSRVWPTLHRTAAASLAFISSCVCTHALCCTFNYSISQHRALPMLLAFIMRTGTDKL